MADFDVQGARKAGYSDAEIADHLASSKKFDASAARQAGYSDKEIIDHLSPGPGMIRRGLNAVGDAVKTTDDYLTTQAMRAAGGLASLPGVVGKGIDWGYRQIGVRPEDIYGPEFTRLFLRQPTENWPTADQISSAALDAMKKKPVNLEGAIPGGKIIDTGVQGAMGALMTGGASLPAMLAGAGGGALSEGAGQVAQEVAPDWEIPARIGGAVVGGVGGAVAPSVARKGADIVKAPIQPFTEGGRQKIASTALRNTAADADTAIANIEKYGIGREAFPDSVPGFKIDAGKASRDPGLMAVAEVAAARNPGMRAQVQANNAAVTSTLDDIATGLPSADSAGNIVQTALGKRYDALVRARKEAADPLYQAARKSPDPVKPFPLLTYTADAVAANKGEPAAVMQRARNLLFTTDKNGRQIADRSAKGMLATREALSDMLSSPELGNHSRSLLMEMKTKVDEALNTVPMARKANEMFREKSLPLAPFDPDFGATNKAVAKIIERDQFGKNFTMSAEQVPGQVMKGGAMSTPMVQRLMMAAGGSPEVRQAMQAAYIADFRKAAASRVAEDAAGGRMITADGASRWLQAHRGGAANVLTDAQLKALDDIARNLRDQAQAVPGRTGSPTFDRLASESILGALVSKRFADAPVLHPVRKALGLMYGGADDAVMQVVFDAIADPKIAAALMKKATPGNVKMAEPVLRQVAGSLAVPVSATQGERAKP